MTEADLPFFSAADLPFLYAYMVALILFFVVTAKRHIRNAKRERKERAQWANLKSGRGEL